VALIAGCAAPPVAPASAARLLLRAATEHAPAGGTAVGFDVRHQLMNRTQLGDTHRMAMSRQATKTLGGWVVILGHLIILSWISLIGNISPEQRRTIALTLTPVLTVYFVALVKWFSSDSDPIESRTSAPFNVLLTSVLLPTILMSFAFYLIVSYPSSVAVSSDDLQQWIAGIEVALGLTVGLVVNDLIPRPDPSR
jgi:hypothetical protein